MFSRVCKFFEERNCLESRRQIGICIFLNIFTYFCVDLLALILICKYFQKYTKDPDWKKYYGQAYSCPRDWGLSESWGPIDGP